MLLAHTWWFLIIRVSCRTCFSRQKITNTNHWISYPCLLIHHALAIPSRISALPSSPSEPIAYLLCVKMSTFCLQKSFRWAEAMAAECKIIIAVTTIVLWKMALFESPAMPAIESLMPKRISIILSKTIQRQIKQQIKKLTMRGKRT